MLNDTLCLNIARGDFLDIPEAQIPEFDIVLVNPPFGAFGDHTDAAAATLHRIADVAPYGTPVAAILPSQFLERKGPKNRMTLNDRFRIKKREGDVVGAFKPLTQIACTLYLLEVR